MIHQFHPKSELASNFSLQYLPESNNMVTRIKEKITNYRCSTSSPYLHLRKCIGNSLENMHTDVKVYTMV